MEDFKYIQEAMKKQLDKMLEGNSHLYTLNLEKNKLWEIYMENFPEGTNEIYKEKREQESLKAAKILGIKKVLFCDFDDKFEDHCANIYYPPVLVLYLAYNKKPSIYTVR